MPDPTRGPRLPLLTMRLDPTTRANLEALQEHFNLSRASVIRLAVQRLMQAEGLGKAALVAAS